MMVPLLQTVVYRPPVRIAMEQGDQMRNFRATKFEKLNF